MRVVAGLGLVVVLVGLVPWNDTISPQGQIEPGMATIAQRLDTRWAAVAAVLFVGPHLLIGLRWWLLMRCLPGVAISARETLRINLVGALFNNVSLGSGGGDLAKAVQITRRCPLRRTEVVTVLFVDRFLGLMALAALAGSFVLLDPGGDERLARTGRFIFAVLAAGLVGATFFASHWLRASRPVEALLTVMPLGDLVRRADATVRLFGNRPRTLAGAVLISWLGHAAMLAGTYAAVRALGVQTISPVALCVVMPVVWTVSAVPLTPGAIGISEGVMLFFHASLGCSASEALAIALWVRVLNLMAGLPGAIILLQSAVAGDPLMGDQVSGEVSGPTPAEMPEPFRPTSLSDCPPAPGHVP